MAFLLIRFVAVPAFAQLTQPPFSLSLEEITYEDWPGLHSFAYGVWEGRWIVLCGRKDGVHAFIPPDPFPATEANLFIWMLDPQTGEQWSKSIFTLPADIANQLRGSNPQYAQRENYLYITGGYGKDTLSGNKITYPSLLAIDLDVLSDSLIADTDPSSAFRKTDDSLFMVCGGEMEILDNTFYLFGGHTFTGEYTKPASPAFTQQYTNEVRKFSVLDDGTALTVDAIEILHDSMLFHRRDLNFEPVMYAGEEEGLAAYSGVFQYDGDFPWLHNIYFQADGSYSEDASFTHKFHNYTCPVLNVFDSATNIFYATFFGGISQFYYNQEEDTVEEDLNIPFVDDVTTLVRYADGSSEQISDSLHFDALLGSNAIFSINTDIAQYENNIIKLHALNGTYHAGYIFGGIDAFMPNFTPSLASNRLFKVNITYSPPLPEEITDAVQSISVFPNPAADFIRIQNNSAEIIHTLILLDAMGEEVLKKNLHLRYQQSQELNIKNLPTGFYFLQYNTEENVFVKEIILE